MMAYIDQVDEQEAEGVVGATYLAATKRAGGVANIIKVMSRDGNAMKGSMAFYVSLMKTPGPLSSARREMLAAVVSNVNDCYY